MKKFVQVEWSQEGQVASVKLNRPEIHNAFNEELIGELTDLFRELEKTQGLRVVVLEGEGKSFCAGADLHWMKKMKDYSEQENVRDSEKLNEMFLVMNHFKRPLIGKVHGAALGGGAGLVAVCDYVVTSSDTQFGFTEVRLGLVPAVISPYVLGKIGRTWARAYFLSGERFNAHRAQEMGLVHQVVDKDKLCESVDVVVESFLKAGPEAAVVAKELIEKVMKLESEKELFKYTCGTIAKKRVGQEGQEGMGALLEKRRPQWQK